MANPAAKHIPAAGMSLLDGTDHPTSTWTDSDSAGAVWNFLMATEDLSKGVHNYKYIRDLLQSSIQFMQGTLPAPVAREDKLPVDTVMWRR